MNTAELQQTLLQLPREQRLEIADALYKSLARTELSEGQKQTLNRRIAAADAQPERFSSWAVAKSRIEQKLQQRS